MENNRFFLWIWRINGLAILIAVLFICFQLSQEIIRSVFSGGDDRVITSVADDPSGEENWVLGNPRQVTGSDYILVPLVSEKKTVELAGTAVMSRDSYSDYREDQAKNVLFINGANNRAHWLFGGNEQLLLAINQFPVQYRYQGNDKDTKAIFYQLVSRDTNKDDKLDEKDSRSLAVSKPDGTEFTVLIDVFDQAISQTAVAKDNALIIYQSGGIGYSLIVDLASFTILNKTRLPRVETP